MQKLLPICTSISLKELKKKTGDCAMRTIVIPPAFQAFVRSGDLSVRKLSMILLTHWFTFWRNMQMKNLHIVLEHIYIMVVVLCVFTVDNANARIGAVVPATVNKGKLTLSTRFQHTSDNESTVQDGRERGRLIADYGVNDWYALWMAVEGQDLQGQSPEITRWILDQRVEFTNMQEDNFYSGFRLRVEHWNLDNATDTAHIRMILGKEIGKWDGRINQFFGIETGSNRNDGMLCETRSHVSYGYHPDHRVGVESFHAYGNLSQDYSYSQQQHSVGPTFVGAISDTVRYEAGYMIGISRAAADHAVYVGFSKMF